MLILEYLHRLPSCRFVVRVHTWLPAMMVYTVTATMSQTRMPNCRSIRMRTRWDRDLCIGGRPRCSGCSAAACRGLHCGSGETLLPFEGAGWPWATFMINLAGAFILGALLEGLARSGGDTGWRQRVRLFAGTGFCGAFTTYSTLALEVSLLGQGRADCGGRRIRSGQRCGRRGRGVAGDGAAAEVHRRRVHS